MPISKEDLVALSDEEKVHLIYELQELLQAKFPNDYTDFDEISQEEITMMEDEYASYKKKSFKCNSRRDCYANDKRQKKWIIIIALHRKQSKTLHRLQHGTMKNRRLLPVIF